MAQMDFLLVNYQSDKVCLSKTFPGFQQLPKQFQSALTESLINDAKFQYLGSLSQSRFIL